MSERRRNVLLRFAAVLAVAAPPLASPACAAEDAIPSGPPPNFRSVAEAREIELPFDSDRLDLNAKAKAILDGVAEELKRNSTLTAILAGHADDRGSREYNLALGERRAEAVKTYLAVHGAPVERMAAISYGKEQPRDTSGTKAARAANRRVVVRLEQH